jgi:hypothetical protein
VPKPERLGPLPFPVRTDAERLCAQVILGVRAALRDDPAALAAGEARLVAQFHDALRAHGAIRLPDPSTLDSAEDLIRQARAWVAEQDEWHAAGAGGQPTPGGGKKLGAD